VSELGLDLVHEWAGRFRFATLLTLLAEPEPPSRELLDQAILAGLEAGQDEHEVFTTLVEEGQFAVAERMLDQCDTFTASQIEKGERALAEAHSRRTLELAAELDRLRVRAEAAGYSLSFDAARLEKLCGDSWTRVRTELDAADEELGEWIEAERERLQHDAAGTPQETAIAPLLLAGRIRTADYLLRHGVLGGVGPESFPRLPDWPWHNEPDKRILRWHLDAGATVPPEFRRWHAADDDAQDLLLRADELELGGPTAAMTFTAALERFLGAPDHAPETFPVPGGHLTSPLRDVGGPDLPRSLLPAGGVRLYVGEPATGSAPESAGGSPFLAVGPRLTPPPDGERTAVAVLTVVDLMRLAPLADRRHVALMRMLGRQWPLSAFGAGSPTSLAQLLGEDEQSAWINLCWLIDLAGLGGLEVAEAVAFQTAMEPRLIHVMLARLAGPRPAGARVRSVRLVNEWDRDDRTTAAIEDAALYGVRESAEAVAAFWAALAAAPPGDTVDLDALRLAVALVDEEAEHSDALRAGLAELTSHWMTDPVASFALRRCGVLVGLRRLVDQRLPQALAALAARGDAGGVTAWDAYRYALSPAWSRYRAAQLVPESDEVAMKAVRDELVTRIDDLLDGVPSFAGPADLGVLVAELRAAFMICYPEVQLHVEGPAEAWISAPAEAAYTVLYEVLTNAAEAVGSAGSVLLTIAVVDDDVLLDVYDGGPGLPTEIQNEHRVFRRHVSTRGAARGAGLYLARRTALAVDGELDVIARRLGHPAFPGAHFRLVLPTA